MLFFHLKYQIKSLDFCHVHDMFMILKMVFLEKEISDYK